MTFTWENYRVERTDIVETVEKLFDYEAMRFTGCDDGFRAFYDYWYNELGGEDFWCKTVFLNGDLIAVIALAKAPDGVFTVQELAVSSEKRGRGYGSAILSELLRYSREIIGQEIIAANAVIFPDNTASQRAFQNAGFECVGISVEKDATYYQYRKYY